MLSKKPSPSAWLTIGVFFLSLIMGAASPTTFTYQGRLNNGASNANGSFDLTFTLFATNTGGVAIAGPVTNNAVAVNGGLFTTFLDFGASAFSGADVWLEIGVRAVGVPTFTTLVPRQLIAPTPYSIYAANAGAASTAANFSGTIGATNLAPGAAAANLTASGLGGVTSGAMVLSATETNAALVNAGYFKLGATTLSDIWQPRTNGTPPTPRYQHTAVWTGSEMIIWGGTDGTNYFNTGARYNPALDTWTPMSTNGAPVGRVMHTAVWAGREMIVWGGKGSNALAVGGRYTPGTDSWVAITNLKNGPTARYEHTAVWTGTQMIVWGGHDSSNNFGNGWRYTPTSDTWVLVAFTNAPSARYEHAAVWTGSEMIVWGGAQSDTSGNFNTVSDGGRYNPVSNTWAATSTPPITPRCQHTACWTGSEMLVWSGYDIQALHPAPGVTTYQNVYSSDGARYNPTLDSWSSMTSSNAPGSRSMNAAAWTGSALLVWGGNNYSQVHADGGIYGLANNPWMAMTSIGAPVQRYGVTGVWTGTSMITFGGAYGPTFYNDTFLYTPPRVVYLYQRP